MKAGTIYQDKRTGEIILIMDQGTFMDGPKENIEHYLVLLLQRSKFGRVFTNSYNLTFIPVTYKKYFKAYEGKQILNKIIVTYIHNKVNVTHFFPSFKVEYKTIYKHLTFIFDKGSISHYEDDNGNWYDKTIMKDDFFIYSLYPLSDRYPLPSFELYFNNKVHPLQLAGAVTDIRSWRTHLCTPL